MLTISLAGKVAVVTGGYSGIGLATVAAFLEAGAAGVIAVDRTPEPPALLQGLRHRSASRLLLLAGDVREEAAAQAFTEAALTRFGRLDVLVNNAGTSVVKPLHEHTPDEWDTVVDTNVKALYWAARHVVPVMVRQGGGVILNTGSISGTVGLRGQGAYAASKGAVHQMTRQMAIEYAAQGIRVNAVACGTVDTAIVHQSAAASGDPEAFWAMLRQGHPIGRIATPAEVAKFFAYLASDDASFFTGAVLAMDGGFTAQ